ncbi:MAG: hypothetical protein FWD23_13095 [Oscillospiraceae bacterium]|nr:hypothetical protein [Oscillospiraceae bacterium]
MSEPIKKYSDYTVYVFEAGEIKKSNRTAYNYDALRFICSLQGVLNREKPVLFIDYRDKADKFWLEYISGEGKFLNGADFVHLKSIDDVIETFSNEIKRCGLVIWDKAVPSTLNVAATICGVLDFLPVCGNDGCNEFYEYLTSKPSLKDVSVRIDLTNKFDGKPGSMIYNTNRESTGSAKCDAYIYALENFSGMISDDMMGYILDGAGREWLIGENSGNYENAFVPNVDYLIANRAFVFELSPWDDEVPCDDKNQPSGTDYRVFCEILRRQAEKNGQTKITSVTGFTPWQVKYTDHKNKSKHGAVETEWRHAELLSAHNCIMDADAYGYCGLFNASLYRHYPLKEKYINSHSPKREKYDANKIYVLIYMGDYDSAAWLSIFAPAHFNDKMRGKNPLMWAFNPNLSKRVPMVFDYVYENKTENDFFAAGDSGAGYLNPSLLFSPRIFSGLPDAGSLFIEHNRYYFEKFDMSHVGFIINGHHKFDEKVYNLYAEFLKGGAGHNGHREPIHIKDNIVFMGYLGDLPGHSSPFDGSYNPADIDSAANMAIHWGKEKLYKNFMLFRTILWSPAMVDALIHALKEKDPSNEYVFLNPDDFFALCGEAFEL